MLTLWLLAIGVCTISLEKNVAVAAPPKLSSKLNVEFEWNYLDFVFENETREEAIESGLYNKTNCLPIDVDRWRDKTFVTVIRQDGVPSSLNVISNQHGEGGPLLEPYPSWDWAKADCTGITSVFRIAIDRCDRLWVLDSGAINFNPVCPPQLLAFDLKTSRLINRVEIPNDVAVNATTGRGLLVTPIVQTFGLRCGTTNVYMADVEGYAILLYDGTSFRRFTSEALVYDPQLTNYTLGGATITLEDGPIGMDISPLTQKLYVSPMSSLNMASIRTRTLIASRSGDVDFTEYKDVLTTQSSAKAMTSTGTLFLGLVNNTAIGCWHEFRQLTKDNIIVVAQDAETLEFTSGMKVKSTRWWYGSEELLVLTNRFPRAVTGALNFDEVNYRILKADVRSLTSGTRCAPLLG